MSQHDFFPARTAPSEPATEETVIPLIEEQLVIGKRVVETGTVRLHKYTEERTETIEVPLTNVEWHIEHVPVNEVVTERPAIRQEGETTVYPVMEERVRIVREFVLMEEVRVTRKTITTTEVSSHVLRREQIAEERVAPAAKASL